MLLYTDGEAVYYCLNRGKVTKNNPLKPSTAVELVAYLKSGHNGHHLIPDVELVASMAQARGIPEMALNSIRDMRSAGMSLSAIYSAIEVNVPGNTFVAVRSNIIVAGVSGTDVDVFLLVGELW